LRQKIRNWVTLRTLQPAHYAGGESATENEMLSLRGITTGATFLLVSGVATIGAVAAQTAPTDAPGKPLQLLRIVEEPAPKPKAAAHNKIHAALHRAVAMRNLKRHTVVAEAKAEQNAPTVQDAPPPAVGMEDSEASPNTLAAADQVLAPPPSAAPAMGSLVVGGPMVDVASAAEVNALDLAADKPGNGSANAAPASTPAQAVSNDTVAAKVAAKVADMSAPAAAVISDAASKSDSINAAPAVAAPQAASSGVGSPGWIAQVMAALAGAVAAGALAWFLIGGTPQRSYS
jgi:hypothetical protein